MEQPQTAEGAETAPAAPPVAPPRRRVLAWVLPAVAVVLVAAGGTALQLTAWERFDRQSAALTRTLDQQEEASRALRAGLTATRTMTDAVTAVLAVQDGGLLTADERAGITDAGARAAEQAKAANQLIPSARPSTGVRKFWFWDVNADAERLALLDTRAHTSIDALTGAVDPLRAAGDAARDAASTSLTAAADRAASAESANVPATNEAVLALRAAVDEVKRRAAPFQPRASADYANLARALQSLRDSHAATLAAESGPLEQPRLELEAFARSLAPGILMDFEWADLINGKGEANGYLSGEAAWWYDRGGYATIRLSNSIAQDWPGDAARAIVAHEVGHAITIRCRTMYDTQDAATTEAWATAWAISMGFTADANGTSAYGSPPDSLVQTAAGCR